MCKRNSTESDSVRTRIYKKATVYLVLQSVLLLEAIVLLLIEYRTKAHQYENSEATFAEKRNELFVKIENLSKKNDELVNANNKMTKQNQQLTEEGKLLLKHLREMDGWRCYQSSLYYISYEEKNWTDSQKDCSKRGANLTVINSKEEQEFLKNGDEVWIGLTNMEGRWKWVDGSTLTSSFWASGEPNGHTIEQCAVSSKGRDKTEWYDYPCSSAFKWMCERKPS